MKQHKDGSDRGAVPRCSTNNIFTHVTRSCDGVGHALAEGVNGFNSQDYVVDGAELGSTDVGMKWRLPDKQTVSA